MSCPENFDLHADDDPQDFLAAVEAAVREALPDVPVFVHRPVFQCRCVECDDHFESATPDVLCGRCDYLNACGEEDT